MDETPRPGPFDSYEYTDELIFDIEGVVSFAQHLSFEIPLPPLRGLGVDELEREYRRVVRSLAQIFPSGRSRRRLILKPSNVSRTELAGPHYAPQSGLHISERSG